jgi:hypothetical protein
MALERLTQITEVGIQSGITLRNVNVEGAYVSGVVTATSLNITGGGANFVGVVTATSFNGNVTGNITPTGLVVSGVSTFQSSSFWGDGDIAYFGDGQDLLIFHNSTDSIIRDNGTGDLYIEGGNRIRLTNPTAIETYAVFNQDGASELWYDNVKKFETTSSGVSVFGTSGVGTALLVNGDARIVGIFTVGTGSITLNGTTNQVNVGTGVTIHHTNGFQIGSNTLHSTGLTVNSLNASGVITATTLRASSISATGGTTNERPSDAVTGTIRYNTVSGTLEYFDGTHWLGINAAGYRGVFGGGHVYPGGSPFTAPAQNTIDYLTIAALGNAIDFGDLTNARVMSAGAVSSSTRGVFGAAAFTNNILDYVTIASAGNALDFGDDIANPLSGSASNETRGLWAGGYIHNVIRYITIASTGNAIDFGDLIEQKYSLMDGSVASPTRGIFAGGSAFAPTKTNRIDYVTIATTGNSTNFGDLIVNGPNSGSCSSSTRGIFGVQNGNVDYITIASTGNSVDFGGGGTFNSCAAASNNIRGVFAGGYITNVMQYVTIATTGDAIDFGDLTTLNRWNLSGLSNGHGGLQ